MYDLNDEHINFKFILKTNSRGIETPAGEKTKLSFSLLGFCSMMPKAAKPLSNGEVGA